MWLFINLIFLVLVQNTESQKPITTSPCPSDECWRWEWRAEEGKGSCFIRRGCSILMCHESSMQIAFDSALFGLEDGQSAIFGIGDDLEKQAIPTWDASVSKWTLTCKFNECGIRTMVVNDKLVFSFQVAQEGKNRTRVRSGLLTYKDYGHQDIPVNSINLGGVDIIVEQFGIGVVFACYYNRTITTESNMEVPKEIEVGGTHTSIAEGSLALGFKIELESPLINVGEMQEVKVSWSVGDLNDIKFYAYKCSVCQNDQEVNIIRENCYSKFLDTKPLLITREEINFEFRTFLIDGDYYDVGTVKCYVEICLDGSPCESTKNLGSCPDDDEVTMALDFQPEYVLQSRLQNTRSDLLENIVFDLASRVESKWATFEQSYFSTAIPNHNSSIEPEIRETPQEISQNKAANYFVPPFSPEYAYYEGDYAYYELYYNYYPNYNHNYYPNYNHDYNSNYKQDYTSNSGNMQMDAVAVSKKDRIRPVRIRPNRTNKNRINKKQRKTTTEVPETTKPTAKAKTKTTTKATTKTTFKSTTKAPTNTTTNATTKTTTKAIMPETTTDQLIENISDEVRILHPEINSFYEKLVMDLNAVTQAPLTKFEEYLNSLETRYFTNQATSNSETICPSTTCWNYNSETQKCELLYGCSKVRCHSNKIHISFKPGLFGLGPEETKTIFGFSDVKSELQAIPIWNDNIDVWVVICKLGECGMEYKMIDDQLKFVLSVSQEGRNRKDNAYPHALVEVGNLAVITSSFGIGIDFECTYPTTIQMDAKKELHELIVTGLNEGSGKLDAGFNLDIDKDVVYLGGRISAEVTWSLQGFAKDLYFFISDCDVEIDGYKLGIISNNCYSGFFEVLRGENSWRKQGFSYEATTTNSGNSSTQTLSCRIKICSSLHSCDRATQQSACPTGEEFKLYQYAIIGM